MQNVCSQCEDESSEGSSSESESGDRSGVSPSSLPIALRKGTREAAAKPIEKYGFEHNIRTMYLMMLSPSYRAFVASLQTISIPSDWKVAKQDPKWCAAMGEELEALRKNETWVLTDLPKGKKVVGCTWVYTVKKNPEGKIERYKVRQVARGYT